MTRVSNNGQRIPSGSANMITAVEAESDDVAELKEENVEGNI
jgi:hypothetical protein